MGSRALKLATRMVVLAVLVTTGCSGGHERSKSIVYGTLQLESCGPGPCIRGEERSTPLPGVRLVFSRDEDVVAMTTTDGQGRYRVSLEPGKYSVAAENRGGFNNLRPHRLVVMKATSRRADFHVASTIL
jgi:hypothetical protein